MNYFKTRSTYSTAVKIKVVKQGAFSCFFFFFEHPNRVQPWDFSVLCMLSVPRVASLPRVVSPEGVSVLRVVSREGCQTRGVSVPRVVSPNDWALMYPGAFDSVASLSSQIRGFVSLKISSVNTRSF